MVILMVFNFKKTEEAAFLPALKDGASSREHDECRAVGDDRSCAVLGSLGVCFARGRTKSASYDSAVADDDTAGLDATVLVLCRSQYLSGEFDSVGGSLLDLS